MHVEFCAELSANHLGSLDRALEIVDEAAHAGATSFKIQTWKKDSMCLDRNYVIDSGPWQGRKLFDLYREAWTPWDWHEPIFDYARSKGLNPFSAAFDRESVDFLETLGVDRHKVSSFELTDTPLIRHMATKGKPILLSTGMATMDEVIAALNACDKCQTMILKCTSAYPAAPADANLSAFSRLSHWGLSDHSRGIGVAVCAVSIGACYVEKHLTLCRNDGGLDAGFSLEPHEFANMVQACSEAAAAIGNPANAYSYNANESTALRRSLWAAKDIHVGDYLVRGDNVVSARPALGMNPGRLVNGYKARLAVKANHPIPQDMLG